MDQYLNLGNQSISIAGLIALFGVLTPLFAITRGMFNTILGVFAVGAATFAVLGGLAVLGYGSALTLECLSALAAAILTLAPRQFQCYYYQQINRKCNKKCVNIYYLKAHEHVRYSFTKEV